jgi:ABC-type multidrug transport system fused ATPase/permease subunit
MLWMKYFTRENRSFNTFQEKHYHFWRRVFTLPTKSADIWSIDFDKPWWKQLLAKKSYYQWQFLMEVINSVFWVVLPLIIAFSFETRNYAVIISALSLRIVFTVIIWFFYKSWVFFIEKFDLSISFSAIEKLLSVDPIYDTTKDTGKFVSKLQRASQSFFGIFTTVFWQLISIVTGVITSVVSFFAFDWRLGLFLAISFSILMILTVFLGYLKRDAFEQYSIEEEDKLKSLELETMQQPNYIRSLFATDYQLNRLRSATENVFRINYADWRSGGIVWNAMFIIYFLVGLGLVLMIIWLIESSGLQASAGVALMATFFLGSNSILNIGNLTNSMVKNIISLNDSFKYINEYGSQTYPVLEGDVAAEVERS